MDKKLPQNLDPKLKEAYDRVMGFAQSTAQPITVTPTTAIPKIPQTPPIAVKPTPAFIANDSKKESQSISPVILVVLAVVFFLVYAVFWVKFFQVPLPIPIPFLNS